MSTREYERRHRSRRSRSPRASVFSRIKHDRSRSPRQNSREKEGGVFKRLGNRRKSVSARSDSRNRHSYSRYTQALFESEDSEGGHWKSRSKKKKSSRDEDDLSQPWVCEEIDPFTPRIRYFDLPKTRMPSPIKTYDESKYLGSHKNILGSHKDRTKGYANQVSYVQLYADRKREEILFPPLNEEEGTEGPMIIEAKIEGHCIHRMYVDGGSAIKIMYEHCFNRLRLEIKKQLVPSTTHLIGFSGEIIWPIKQIQPLVRIGDKEHFASAWMIFVVVRSPSPYNRIIRRPKVKKLQAVSSTAHGMLKLPVEGRVITLKSSWLVPLECALVSRPGETFPATKPNLRRNVLRIQSQHQGAESMSRQGNTRRKVTFIGLGSGRGIQENKTANSGASHADRPNGKGGAYRLFGGSQRNDKRGPDDGREAKQMPIYFVSRALRGVVKTGSSREAKKWSIELGEYAIHYKPRVSVKGQILADFIVERPEEDSLDILMEMEEELPEPWILFRDGSSCTDGSGAGLILTNPKRMEFTYALRFRTYVTKEVDIIRYLEKVRTLTNSFKAFSIRQVPRSENKKAGVLSKIESTSFAHLEETLPADVKKARTIKRKSQRIGIINGTLYKKSFLGPWLQCNKKREQEAIREAKSKAKMKKYYNFKVRSASFKPGDLVYRNNDASRTEDTGKLGPKWKGPYEVTEALGKGAYKLRDRDEKQLPRTWNVSNLKNCHIYIM
nr:reverse transcriptase domain-containing protein [Tanacetum cinerariifolium]